MSAQGMNKDLTQEEIDNYSKNEGLFPELNYEKQNISTEILGIERVNNVQCYVLKSVSENSEKFDYYSVDGYFKIQTVEVETKDGETVESTTSYADHKDVSGIIFPHSKTISANGMTFNGTSTFEVNGNQKIEDYITK